MIRLLAMDLDGTLLAKGSVMPEQNVEAIKRAREQGVHTVICSGRSVNPLDHYCGLAGIRGSGSFAIGFNGALIYEIDNRRIIRDIRLERELARRVEAAITGFEVETVAYSFDRLFATAVTERVERYSRLSMTSIELVQELAMAEGGLSKLLSTGETAELLRLEELLNKKLGDECNIVMTSPTLLEITAPGADKGSAVMYLAEYLGIDMNEVAAMGDYHNDIHMIRAAGIGIAVANAAPEVKAIADYVTEADNNQGAVREVIERFIH